MQFRLSRHLLALTGLLIAFGGQPARSRELWRPAALVGAAQRRPAASPVSAAHLATEQTMIAATTALTGTAPLTNTTYLPLARVAIVPEVDLSIDSLEITQAVQTPSNSVPLVAARPTIVRVYARYTGVTPGAVTVSLMGTRNGVDLPPVTLGPQAISSAPSRGTYSSSFNLQLPDSWLSGTVSMVATIDSDASVPESNESNNTATATLSFNTVPALDLVIVPIRYTHTGADNPGVYPAPKQDTVSDFIRRTYPVSQLKVTFHPEINFTGDLTFIEANGNAPYWGNDSNTGLLDVVTTLKRDEVESSSPKVYYGLVSTITGNNTWLPVNSGFILGIGWIGQPRAGAGLDIPDSLGLPAETTSVTAAHEIGHNLNRLHAPCDTDTGLDPSYPAKDASIVQFGVDVSKGKVLNPSTTKDVMSYCDPTWVSDYTYKALYTALRGNGLAAASATPQLSLLVRASFGPDGTPALAPTYALEGLPDAAPESSDYRVEFLDATGVVVGSRLVAVSEMEQPHIFSRASGRLVQQESALGARGMDTRAPRRAIYAIVPLPAQPFVTLRLVHGGAVVATRAFSPPTATTATAATPSAAAQPDGSLLLRWGSSPAPALVRYTVDGGKSWTTLGVDVVGGALSVDPSTLPSGTGRFEITIADAGG